MSYRRSKVVRDAEYAASARCPPPCGKARFLSRASARKHANRIHGQTGRRYRVYSGDSAAHESCHGFFHLASFREAGRESFYRECKAQAAVHGLPLGWSVGVTREARRWRYTVYVPDEEPMPSLHTYISAEAAQSEGIADVLGESRSA